MYTLLSQRKLEDLNSNLLSALLLLTLAKKQLQAWPGSQPRMTPPKNNSDHPVGGVTQAVINIQIVIQVGP